MFVADRPLRASPRQPETARRTICENEAVRIVKQVIEDKLDGPSRVHGEGGMHKTLAGGPKTGAHVRIARDETAALINGQSFPDPETVDADVALCSNGLASPSRAERLRGILDDGNFGRQGTHEIPDAGHIGQRAAIVRCDHAERVRVDQLAKMIEIEVEGIGDSVAGDDPAARLLRSNDDKRAGIAWNDDRPS